MKLLAHIVDDDGRRREQSIKEHSFQTAKYAAESVEGTSFSNLAFLAGILHDCGKSKEEFQIYLEAACRGGEAERGSVIHSFAGVIYLFERYHTSKATKWEKLTCEIAGYAIGSHHGMFDCVDMDGKSGFEYRLKKDREEICYEESVRNFLSEVMDEGQLNEYFSRAVKEAETFFEEASKAYAKNGKNVFFQISMLTRLVLSAVIYGDRRDTGEFMSGRRAETERRISWKEQREFFERKLDGLKGFNADLEINRVRNFISEQCMTFAERPDGIYRLNVPTGAGKTLCSLRYALAHAERYKKKRIIFIIPLLSVLDQNVQVIREYLKDPGEILEHHSNLIRTKDTEEEMDRFEVLADNWHAPVIVSTLVQLLEILFSHEMSAVGRMQSLCDSVIVIDEVQSLPKKMTVMFNLAMNFLHQFCHATIVLSSATQPCFDELKWPLHLSDTPDLVRLSSEQLKVFERAKIIDMTNPYGMSLEECAAFCGGRMERHASLLVVCNTRAEARILAKLLREQADRNGWELYHLSASMCQTHRMDVLEKLSGSLARIQAEVKEGKPGHRLICISTQMGELGMDLSFEGVVRILAGIDNLVQATGRCNRSNEYGQTGSVYLINLKNENLSTLREIISAQNSTKKVLEYLRQHPEESCIGGEAMRNFYRCMFRETEKEIRYPAVINGITVSLADLLSNCHVAVSASCRKEYILYQPFRTVGCAFHVFDQDTTDVLTPYGEGKALIKKLREMEGKPFNIEAYRELMNRTKPYTVSLFQWQRSQLEHAKLLTSALGGRVLILEEAAYDEYGVTV